MNPKTPVVYSCETCYFITINKKDYSRHLLSRKHQELNPKTTYAHCDGIEITPSIPIKPTEYECQYCNRLFRSRTTIYQHKVKCQQQHIEDTNYIVTPIQLATITTEQIYNTNDNVICSNDSNDNVTITKSMFMELLNNEWANANPRCLNSNTRENEKYFRLSKIVTDGDKEGNIAKVIRKVAKRVGIEKPVIETVSVGEEETNSLL